MQNGEISQLLQALGEPRRLNIVLALLERDRDVEDLARTLGLAQPTVSHHLGVLRKVGLVTRRRMGRFQDYQILPGRLRELSEWLGRAGTQPEGEPLAARYRELILGEFLEQPAPRVLPAHPRKRLLVSRWLLDQLETGRFYSAEEMKELMAGQLTGWEALLEEWLGQHELDGNGMYYRKP